MRSEIQVATRVFFELNLVGLLSRTVRVDRQAMSVVLLNSLDCAADERLPVQQVDRQYATDRYEYD